MALQDLTPQLRTRLSRVERTVGLFVTIATLLLLAGFVFYIYRTAQRKGWLKTKVQYSTSLNNAAGLKPGDPIKLMGFNVGEITEVIPEAPGAYYGVTVYFTILDPNFGYIWLDSKVRIAPADFLGNRNLEIVKGYNGAPTVLTTNNGKAIGVLDGELVKKKREELKTAFQNKAKEENPDWNEHAIKMEAEPQTIMELNTVIKSQPNTYYVNLKEAKPLWIEPLESPALTERLETLVSGLESSLPNIFDLTNKLSGVLTNASSATAQLNTLLAEAHPVVTNLAIITSNIRDPKGSLGEWLIPTNLNQNLNATLKSATTTLDRVDSTLQHTDTNLVTTFSNVNLTLQNLAGITSNLNVQVQSNSNILSNVSSAVVQSDELMQGLKKHWLLRSAFKTNKTSKATPPKSIAPKLRK